MLIWDDSFTVNVRKFDTQHREIIRIIVKLETLMKSEDPDGEIMSVLSRLVEYSESHFKDEEELMASYGYSGLEQQIQEHNRFKETLAGLIDDYEKGDRLVLTKTLVFLSEWLKNHITVTDKQYSGFFREQGVR